jgi:hypothetical protein
MLLIYYESNEKDTVI